MWFAHVFFCYCVFLSGLGCLLSRVVVPIVSRGCPTRASSLGQVHTWLGRAYIMSMLWATASSLVIHNTGLPVATLISFIWVLGGLCVGWVAVLLHSAGITAQTLERAGRVIRAEGLAPKAGLANLLAEQRGAVAAERTFAQRLLSWKTLHGCVMFTSWINISGRIFASNQSGDFTCYTYPVYKALNTPQGDFRNTTAGGGGLTLVPASDPDYARLPWAQLGLVQWGVALSVGPMLAALLVGAVVAFAGARAVRAAGGSGGSSGRQQDLGGGGGGVSIALNPVRDVSYDPNA